MYFFWGGEFYEDPFLYHIDWIHDAITLRYVKRAYIFFKKWPRHPIKILKQLWWFLNYKKNIQKSFELKKRTVHRINYLLLDSNCFAELEKIKNIYGMNVICNLPLFYNQNFDLANKLKVTKLKNNAINVQIGNSATEANNHVDCFRVLKKHTNKNLKLILPLSYGTPKYLEFVKKHCITIFKNKCEFLEKFLPREEYIDKLNEVDIAIMFHNRSQAFGNCIALLTLGKKLFIKSNNPMWHFFSTSWYHRI